jgi:hypothetical protein
MFIRISKLILKFGIVLRCFLNAIEAPLPRPGPQLPTALYSLAFSLYY